MITFTTQTQRSSSFQAIVIPFFKDEIDQALIESISGIKAALDFKAGAKEVLVLYHPTENQKIYLVGLGDKTGRNKSSQLFRSFAFHHHKNWPKAIEIELSHLPVDSTYQAVLGIQLASYAPDLYKTDKRKSESWEAKNLNVQIAHPDKEAKKLAKTAQITAQTQAHMMGLVDSPPNKKLPEDLASYALESAKKYGFEATVLYKDQLEEQGLHAVLAVGKGSNNPPVMIILEYKGKASKTPQLGLVGKGITFDTGGLSIKGASNMHYMKSDMGGAAAVMGAIESAARLALPIHLVGIIPAAENSVDALSVKPGDVINSYSGKTIEIIDTDAEGRLILADGLAYLIKNYQPEVIIDLATLTGSCVRTFGYYAAGLFSNHDGLANRLSQAGMDVHERVWRLPIWKDYESDIHSDIADVKNFSGKPVAGAIAAAKFLEAFTADHPQWAHLDIAGVAFGDSEFTKMKSATGFGVRLLLEYMNALITE